MSVARECCCRSASEKLLENNYLIRWSFIIYQLWLQVVTIRSFLGWFVRVYGARFVDAVEYLSLNAKRLEQRVEDLVSNLSLITLYLLTKYVSGEQGANSLRSMTIPSRSKWIKLEHLKLHMFVLSANLTSFRFTDTIEQIE